MINDYILMINETGFTQALDKQLIKIPKGVIPTCRTHADISDHWQCILLRVDHKRPRRRATECRDEVSPSHPSLLINRG
jgi:hypothetical protein